MKLDFWGTRGSISTNSKETQRYGGHTACVSVSQGNHILILDAGSGIIRLGKLLQQQPEINIHILLTHLHMDHIQGLGFFKPFFNPAPTVHLWGPRGNARLAKRLNRYLSPPLFPVRIRDFDCTLTLREFTHDAMRIGPFEVTARHVCHPGPTVGFHITNGTTSVAYLPDHEPALGVRNFPIDPEWTSGYSIARDVDILIHDAQFTDEEYPEHMGWGHSSVTHALEFARLAGVRRLELFHHDASHTDDQLDAIQLGLPEMPFAVRMAKEGSTLQLD